MSETSNDGNFHRIRTVGDMTFEEFYFAAEGVYRALRSDPPNSRTHVEARFDADGRLTELMLKEPASRFEVPLQLLEGAGSASAGAGSDLGRRVEEAMEQSAATHSAVMNALQQPMMPPRPQF
jgi:hypothetical protein